MGFLFKTKDTSGNKNNSRGSYFKNNVTLVSFGYTTTASEKLFFKQGQNYFSKNIVTKYDIWCECNSSFSRLWKRFKKEFLLGFSLKMSDRVFFFSLENAKTIFEEMWKTSTFQEKLQSLKESDKCNISFCYKIRDRVFSNDFKPTFEDYKSLKYWNSGSTSFIIKEEKQWLRLRSFQIFKYDLSFSGSFIHSIIFLIDINDIKNYNASVKVDLKQWIEANEEQLENSELIVAILDSEKLQLRIDETKQAKKSLDSLVSSITLGKNYDTALKKCQEWLKNDIFEIFNQDEKDILTDVFFVDCDDTDSLAPIFQSVKKVLEMKM